MFWYAARIHEIVFGE
jgi:hypothetical protein